MARGREPNARHVRGGNCWAGNTRSDVCMKHEQPRGECDECLPCPACKLPAPSADASERKETGRG